MKFRFITALHVVVIVTAQTAAAQTMAPEIPPLPDAAALAKAAVSNVNYSSGTPQIGVPIHTIRDKSVSLDISLSYNAAGIRVEDEATFVGLGWTMNFGGVVTRVIRSLPDDFTNGYMHTSTTVSEISSGVEYSQVDNGLLDAEADEFTISLPGFSTSFFYDQGTQTFVQRPFTGVEIKAFQVQGRIDRWEIVAPNGLVYYFGKSRDGNRSAREQIISEETTVHDFLNGFSSSTGVADNAVSSWYLLDIFDPNTEVYAKFSYSSFTQTVCRKVSESLKWNVPNLQSSECFDPDTGIKVTYNETTSQTVQIDSIVTAHETVTFQYSGNLRQDINGGRPLHRIVVNTADSVTVKIVEFDTDYFQSASAPASVFCNTPHRFKRLRLNSVKFIDPTDNLTPIVYTFTYNTEVNLPDKLSNAQDYWGYYNGKTGNSSLIPRAYLPNYAVMLPGADRTVSSTHSRAWILTSIKHPTGAVEFFFYENNLISNGNELLRPECQMIFNPLVTRNVWLHQMSGYYYNEGESTGTYDVYDTTFSVGENLRGMLNFVISGCPDFNSTECDFQLSLIPLEGQLFDIVSLKEPVSSQVLPPGSYKLRARVYGDSRDCGEVTQEGGCAGFSIILTWSEDTLNTGPLTHNLLVGSQRISKITLDESVGSTLVRRFDYNSLLSETSSGRLIDVPVYASSMDCGDIRQHPTGDAWIITLVPNAVMLRTSKSYTGFTDNLTYQNVTEHYDDALAGGKTEYAFSFVNPSSYQQASYVHYLYPFPPLSTRSWRNNQLLSTKKYEKVASGYRLIATSETQYTIFNEQYFSYLGLKIGENPFARFAPHAHAMSYVYCTIIPYETSVDKYLPTSQTETSISYFDDGSPKSLTTVKNFTYGNLDVHHNPTRIAMFDSRGVENTTEIVYSAEMAGVLFDSMMRRNMVVPIEQIESAGNTPVKKSKTNYGWVNTSHLLPIATEIAEDGVNFRLQASYHYNSDQDIARVTTPGEMHSAFLWNDSDKGVVAYIQNAAPEKVAYTSFEDNAKNGWTYGGTPTNSNTALSGKKVYNLSVGQVTKSGLDASPTNTYILTFWARSVTGSQNWTFMGQTEPLTGQWKLISREVAVSSLTLSGSNIEIDELRLHPSGALMKTFAYSGGLLTTGCDENTIPFYYQYDGLGRLLRVVDQDGNMTRSFHYHYHNQQ